MHNYELQGKFIRVDARHVEEISPAANQELWATIEQASSEYGVNRILVESGARRRSMGFMDVYRTAKSPIRDDIRSLQVAFFMPHYEPDEFTELFVSMAAERGHRMRFFKDETETIEWLTQT